MKKYAVLAVFLGGCAGAMKTETIHLAHGKTGERVQCGPYSRMNMGGPGSEERELRACVEDFQKAGYQRVSAP